MAHSPYYSERWRSRVWSYMAWGCHPYAPMMLRSSIEQPSNHTCCFGRNLYQIQRVIVPRGALYVFGLCTITGGNIDARGRCCTEVSANRIVVWPSVIVLCVQCSCPKWNKGRVRLGFGFGFGQAPTQSTILVMNECLRLSPLCSTCLHYSGSFRVFQTDK